MAASAKIATCDNLFKLVAQYGCGPVKFTRIEDALYERHLLVGNIVGTTRTDSLRTSRKPAQFMKDTRMLPEDSQ
jgi:hypothetical protein